MFRNYFANVTFGWQYAEKGQRTGIDDLLSVHEHGQLAVASFDQLNVHFELTPQVGRHPGGLDT